MSKMAKAVEAAAHDAADSAAHAATAAATAAGGPGGKRASLKPSIDPRHSDGWDDDPPSRPSSAGHAKVEEGKSPRVHAANPRSKGSEAKAESSGAFDDFFSPLDLEVYVNNRIRLSQYRFERMAPAFAKAVQRLDYLSIFCNMVAGILATIGYALYVPIAVALSIIFISLQDYFCLPGQGTASNDSTVILHGLISYWDSLSLIQKKTREVKAKICKEGEDAIILQIQAKAAAAPPKKKKKSPLLKCLGDIFEMCMAKKKKAKAAKPQGK